MRFQIWVDRGRLSMPDPIVVRDMVSGDVVNAAEVAVSGAVVRTLERGNGFGARVVIEAEDVEIDSAGTGGQRPSNAAGPSGR